MTAEKGEQLMNFSWKTAVGVPVAVAALVFPLAGTASAISFDWTAEFNTAITSREYASRAKGTHTINLNRGQNCQNLAGRGPEVITVQLWVDDWGPDSKIGPDIKVLCFAGGAASFANVEPDDEFYFRLVSNYDGARPNRVITGNVVYP